MNDKLNEMQVQYLGLLVANILKKSSSVQMVMNCCTQMRRNWNMHSNI